MDEIHVMGGSSLSGEISIQGSKNAALPMMAASLMHRGTSVLRGCPGISDVFCMEEILKSLGAVTRWKGHDLYLDCTDADQTEVSALFTGRMRSSVILLAAVLGRNKVCRIGYPGGCTIGKRPIDLHLMALKELGAEIEENSSYIYACCNGFRGTEIVFGKSSVGATQQAILAAVLAEGETILKNCAGEPEVVWLCRYLRSMGAEISGEGKPEIRIRGVRELSAGDFHIPPDRIVAGTYMCAAAVTKSEIRLRRVPLEEMKAFLDVYRKMGGQYEWKSGKLIANGAGIQFSVPFLETEAYPGFPTDLQSPLLAVLTTVPGISRIRENIFENRFKICSELTKMGAHIEVRGSEVKICGSRLKGCRLRAEELRGGAALVIAALAADGESVIEGVPFIRRGYEDICRDLRYLQAEIYMEDILSV